MQRSRIVSALFIILSLTATAASGQFKASDLARIVNLSSPRFSPDGKTAVYVSTHRDVQKNRIFHNLVRTDLEGDPVILVRERASLSKPEWSPSGERIYYLAAGTKGQQIFAIPTAGGESFQVGAREDDVKSFALSPDGKRMALIVEEAKPARNEASGFNDSFEVGNTGYLTQETGRVAYLAVSDIDGGNCRRLSDSAISLATGLSVSSLSWSPDGAQIVFTAFPTPNSGDSDLGRVYTVDTQTGSLHPQTAGLGNESDASFSPDGRWLYFLAPRDYVPSNAAELHRTALGSGRVENISKGIDREVAGFRVLGSGEVLMWGYSGAKSSLWLYSSGKIRPIGCEVIADIAEVSVSGLGSILMTGEEAYRPTELYYKSRYESTELRLTNYNSELAALPHGIREEVSWLSSGGFRANGIITYPPGFSADKKYPLVLLIHGGPTAASTLGFNMMPQLMAAKGWVVLEPNYRGSNNLGNAFQSAIMNDAAEGPGEDVIAGVKELLKMPYLDASKVAVSGWSYGGWMTAWMIGRYPEVWAAAMAGAAPVDLTDMYSLSDLNRMRRHAITSSPYVGDNFRKALDQSPINHFSKLRTPTLVMSKTRDERVTITGSYKLHSALRDNGVKTQFIAYPGGGHTVTDPVRSVDLHERWLAWLEQYLK